MDKMFKTPFQLQTKIHRINANAVERRRGRKRFVDPVVSVLTPILAEMVVKSKRILVTHESHEVLIIRGGTGSKPYYCPQCNLRTEMVTIERAARMAEVSIRQIYYAIDDGRLHSVETGYGGLLICGRCLGDLK